MKIYAVVCENDSCLRYISKINGEWNDPSFAFHNGQKSLFRRMTEREERLFTDLPDQPGECGHIYEDNIYRQQTTKLN